MTLKNYEASKKKNTQGFIKDTSFEHENEFRVMIEMKQKEKKKVEPSWVMLHEQAVELNKLNDSPVISLNLSNFKDLPFEIIFHPQSHDWHRKNIKKIIDKFELKFGLTDSTLRDIFK